MASFEQGFSRKLVKDFLFKAQNEIIFLQASHVYSSSSANKNLGYQLLVEGKREGVILPDECEVMGILDETGESLAEMNYIGAQRRDSNDPMSIQHSNSVNSNNNGSILKEQEI
jgi:hypothetical protein